MRKNQMQDTYLLLGDLCCFYIQCLQECRSLKWPKSCNTVFTCKEGYVFISKCRQVTESVCTPILLYVCQIYWWEHGCNLETAASIFETDLSPIVWCLDLEARCRMLGFWYNLCNTSNSDTPKIWSFSNARSYACKFNGSTLRAVQTLEHLKSKN